MNGWLNVVGVGADGLEGVAPAARALIEGADLLVGGERHLSMVANGHAERRVWEFPLDDIVAAIRDAHGKRVVVLATGDPMAFGIGSTLARHFAADEMTILPAPGAFSLAAARLAWPLHGCTCLTLHGRPLELLNHHMLPGRRLLILSHDGTTPEQVAAALRNAGFEPSRISVFEEMGTPGETRRDGTAESWEPGPVRDLNTIGVECIVGAVARARAPVPGLPDDAFVHDGKLTKRIVRAATLAALAPMPGQYLWDLGAGCGSVAIEWLRAAQDVQGRGARATAVERDAGRGAMIATNASRLGTPYLDIVMSDIDRALPELDDPHAVFVGGGLTTPGLIDTVLERLASGGRMVANAVTLEGEAVLLAAFAAHGGTLDRIAVAHADPVGGLTGWRPAMPVTQWALIKS
jgi:precorrin-6Y C5,15-methyltransferase (decarboxylating)